MVIVFIGASVDAGTGSGTQNSRRHHVEQAAQSFIHTGDRCG
jgi:hypothetical protein